MKHSAPNDSVGFLISQTYRKLTYALFLRFKEFDITPEQWGILHRLSHEDGINQKEIAKRSAKDQPTTARILDVLHKKELIDKKMSSADRRAFLVYITDKGKALIAKTIPIEQQCLAEVLQGIESSDLQLFKQILAQIDHNISSMTNSKRG